MSGVSLGAIHSPFGPLLYPCLTHHQSFDRRFVPARAEEMKKPKKKKDYENNSIPRIGTGSFIALGHTCFQGASSCLAEPGLGFCFYNSSGAIAQQLEVGLANA